MMVLVAKCRKGCVTGWCLMRLPPAEVGKFIGLARSHGYAVEERTELPASVNLECEHR